MTIKFLLFYALFFASCNLRTQPKTADSKIDTAKIDTTILRTVQSNSNDTFVKNSIDTSKYLNLPYCDSSMPHHSGSTGYIDTFTIHNYKFRIIHQDTMFDGVVEKYQNGNWYRIMKFENLGNHNDYDVSLDLDGDGFRDLIFYWKWHGEIHFFDPLKNEFCDTINCDIRRDWALIDTANRIFFENDFGKLLNSPVSSNLFTFRSAKRIELASLEINFEKDSVDDNIINCKLSLAKQNKTIEKFVPPKKIDVVLFDYQKFWEKRYKKIMRSR
jgi:hypothetical protein